MGLPGRWTIRWAPCGLPSADAVSDLVWLFSGVGARPVGTVNGGGKPEIKEGLPNAGTGFTPSELWGGGAVGWTRGGQRDEKAPAQWPWFQCTPDT